MIQADAVVGLRRAVRARPISTAAVAVKRRMRRGSWWFPSAR